MDVLIATASKHGATKDIGHAIARALEDVGVTVEDVDPEDVASLDGYDAVVLGSAVYGGDWLPAANDLIRRLGDELRLRPVWLFSSGPLGDPPLPEGEPNVVERLMAEVQPRGHRVFSGRLERDDLGLAERTIAKVLRAPMGDFRQWPAIRAWAREIAGALAVSAGARA
jgi:menaquinone-dependent protoporphyrinogen oxidase